MISYCLIPHGNHIEQVSGSKSTCEHKTENNVSTSVNLLVFEMIFLFGAVVEFTTQNHKSQNLKQNNLLIGKSDGVGQLLGIVQAKSKYQAMNV